MPAEAHDHYAAGIVDTNGNNQPNAGEPLQLVGVMVSWLTGKRLPWPQNLINSSFVSVTVGRCANRIAHDPPARRRAGPARASAHPHRDELLLFPLRPRGSAARGALRKSKNAFPLEFDL